MKAIIHRSGVVIMILMKKHGVMLVASLLLDLHIAYPVKNKNIRPFVLLNSCFVCFFSQINAVRLSIK
jgi:hypothetical protein